MLVATQTDDSSCVVFQSGSVAAGLPRPLPTSVVITPRFRAGVVLLSPLVDSAQLWAGDVLSAERSCLANACRCDGVVAAAVTAHLSGLHSAIKMLCGKLAVIKERMDHIAAGQAGRLTDRAQF